VFANTFAGLCSLSSVPVPAESDRLPILTFQSKDSISPTSGLTKPQVEIFIAFLTPFFRSIFESSRFKALAS
jgi:hypothetical protein